MEETEYLKPKTDEKIKSEWHFSKAGQWGALISLIFVIAIIILGIWAITTQKKYQVCLDKCEIEYPNLDNTGADSLTKFVALQENKKCQASCREKYGK